MVKRALLGLLALLLVLAAVLAVNTWRQGSQQIEVQPLPPLAVDEAGAAASLAAAVQARTVSGLLDPAGAAQAFDQLQAHLQQRYPLVHAKLKLERVDRSLVFTWPGSDAKLKPVAMLAHQDVAPIAPGTEGAWKQPPFSGVLDGGFVWGRGAWDNKGNLIAQLEALEMLLKAGFQPRRTIMLVAGHDEELGGIHGAIPIAKMLRDRGTRFEWVIDEGLTVTEGIVPGIAAPVALVGVAEKGYVSLVLSAEAVPGHSSMPPAPGVSAVGRLAHALTRLDDHPMPGGLEGVAGRMFQTLAPEMGGVQRVVMSNLWLLRPVVERLLSRTPSTNAMLRTTTAITMLRAGIKENVLPGSAEAVVNFRLLPGDSAESVTEHIRKVVKDSGIEVRTLTAAVEASRVSPSDSDAYRLVARTVREVFPGAVVAPGLMLGGTDSRWFDDIADHVFRFSPVRTRPEDLARFHGTDERLPIAHLAEMIRFYHRLLSQSAS